MNASMHMCVSMHECMFVRMHTFERVHVCVCVNIHIYLPMYLFFCFPVFYLHIYMYILRHLYMHACARVTFKRMAPALTHPTAHDAASRCKGKCVSLLFETIHYSAGLELSSLSLSLERFLSLCVCVYHGQQRRPWTLPLRLPRSRLRQYWSCWACHPPV